MLTFLLAMNKYLIVLLTLYLALSNIFKSSCLVFIFIYPFVSRPVITVTFIFQPRSKRRRICLNAITKELVLRKCEITDQVETIYFGGGTPSLLSQEEIHQILDA